MKVPFLVVNKPQDYAKFFVDENWIDFLLHHLNPMYSLTRTKAKVVQIRTETESTKTFILKPNFHWKEFKPGQHVLVTHPVGGKLLSRYYSLTSIPGESLVSITVKKQPNGIFSNHLHSNLQVGSILELGSPEGEFVLPSHNSPMLWVAGGSGITPFFSMIQYLSSLSLNRDITLLYYSTTEKEMIFSQELQSISKNLPNLKIHLILTNESNPKFHNGFLNQSQLETLCPDYQNREVYVCGPSGLQSVLESLVDSSKIRRENFVPISTVGLEQNEVTIELLKSGKSLKFKGDKPLLDELEENGVFPLHGCRMGVCHTCVCTKESGVIRNLSSGKISDSGEETIQLCNTRAESDLKLNL